MFLAKIMIILLHGADTFRAREKLNEILKEYQAKHRSGLNLLRFDKADLTEIRQAIESVSMFDEKKLIILKNFLEDKKLLDDFFAYAKKRKLKDNQEVIIIFYQENKAALGKLKSQLTMSQEFKQLAGLELVRWVKSQALKHGGQIDNLAANKLIAYAGQDLWQLDNQLQKLVSYKAGKLIEHQDVDRMVKANLSVNIFKTLEALAGKDKKQALRLLGEHLKQGENEIYILSMLIYQIRVLLRLKDLMVKGTPYQQLAKITKLHPYVVKKNSSQLRNFSLDQLKQIYRRLLDLDWQIKTGRLDGLIGLSLLIEEI